MIDLRQLKNKFTELYQAEPQIFSAPGRVNLIGEHTDYNEGFVLPFAINYRTFVLAFARDDRQVKVFSQTINEQTEFSLDEDFSAHEKNWTIYVKGITRVLQQKGFNLKGANILIDSDVPFGAGLSSSAALEISLGLALTSISNSPIDLVELAFLGQKVEHEFVGVKSGIMDQFAAALSRKNHALLIDCRSLETTYVPLILDDATLVVCDTRVKHELASSAYNTRRAECEQGVEILREKIPRIKSLRDVSERDLIIYADFLPENVRRRCLHVVRENARTLAAVEALKNNNLAHLGKLMLASHESLRDDYEVSCAELDTLVEIARKTEGVLGARMTGGGFGGCTVNLLKSEVFEEFQNRINRKYSEKFGFAPEIYLFEASDGADKVSSSKFQVSSQDGYAEK